MEIQDIKNQLPISQVLAHYNLTPDRNNRLCCPWHPDKTPSLQIYPNTNTWTCFSSNCNAGSGDVIDFIMRMEKSTKHEAIQKAKVLLGKSIIKKQESKPIQNLEQIPLKLDKLYAKFQTNYKKSQKAQEYAKNRLIQESKSGYNGGSWPYLKNCLIFPLRNATNQIVSFYGRSIIGTDKNKHYYLKGRSGLYPNYPNQDTETLILTESIIDSLHIEGEVLAMYGTNGLTAEHIDVIQNLPNLREVILFFDGDEAGDAAIKKVSQKLHEVLQSIKISHVETPRDTDINSLVTNHPDSYQDIIQDLIDYRIEFSFSIEDSIEKNKSQSVTTNLNTTNPELLTYTTDQLHLLILGGIRLTGLDKLRVTLKITHRELLNRLPIRSSLDLYHSRQVEQLTEKISQELEINQRNSCKIISDLTGALETYRQDRLQQMQPRKKETKALTQDEKSAALKYLKHKKLMELTRKDLATSGLVGEADNALIALMAYTSRKRERPLHIMFLGASGTGKTHTQEKVSAVIPPEDTIEITSLSDNAFYYFGKEELKHKLILIEDLDGADNVMYPLRELQSKRKISKKVTLKDNKGNLKTITVEVEGPVSVSGCTTRERLYEDNANRCILLYIDGSKDQDKRIMNYQQKVSAGVINKHTEELSIQRLQNVQRLLRPIKVINPYAELIDLPDEVFKPRRSLLLLLSFIESITYYHQYQRLIKTNYTTGESYIQSTKEDIALAFDLIKEVLFTKSDELTKACRTFLELLKELVKPGEVFYAREIRTKLRLHPSKLKRYLTELIRHGYIKTNGGSRYKGYAYEINNYEEYQEMKSNLDGKLAEILVQIDEKTMAVTN